MSRDWKVGSRVQDDELVDGKAVIYVGTITEINTVEKEQEKYDYTLRKYVPQTVTVIDNMKVKWDDGEEESVGQYDVYEEDSEHERQFRMVALVAKEKIEAKLAEASKALDEAEEIAEEYGVPFHSGISPLSQSYFPTTTSEKFPDVDSDFINEISDAYHSDYGGEGWQHSAVC